MRSLVSCEGQAPNDECVEAVTVQPRTDTSTVVTGSTVGGTPFSGGRFSSCAVNGRVTAFYQFQGTGARYRLSTCTPETNFNTGLLVSQENCDVLCSEVVSNDNDFGCDAQGFGASVEFFTKEGQLYYVLVRGATSEAVGELVLLSYAINLLHFYLHAIS
jgi:hypothetical protein